MAVVDIAKIVGVSEIEAATAEELKTAYLEADDVNSFTDAEQAKLTDCKPIIILTQTQYDALPSKEVDTLYFIRPEV